MNRLGERTVRIRKVESSILFVSTIKTTPSEWFFFFVNASPEVFVWGYLMKTALITGASRGWAVGINYLNRADKARELVEELTAAGCHAAMFQTDVADSAAVAEMVRKLGETFSPVELVVNNAGVSGQGLFQDTTDEMWDRYLAVNLSGARNTVKAALPHMISEKRGCIVNISSIWGQRGASCEVAYSCTKAGIIALTRSLAMELAPSGIRVNCVAPGVINTDMVQVLGQETVEELIRETPLGRLGTPEDIAYAVAFFASERAGFITGQVLTADGGFIV